MEKRVLFDLDGTLVDSMGKIFEAVSGVFVVEGLEKPSFEDYVLNFRFPFETFYCERGVKLSPKEIFKTYSTFHGHYNPRFFDDALSAIHRLHSTQHKPSIVTANSPENVLRVLESVNLVNVLECKSASDKVEAIREFVGRSSLGGMTPYVGDIVADMRDAKRAGARPVAVLRNGLMKLGQEFLDAGASICIRSLKDIDLVLR